MGALAEKTLLGIREDVSKTLQVSSVDFHLVVKGEHCHLQSLGIPQERADEICLVAVPEVRCANWKIVIRSVLDQKKYGRLR